MNPMTPQQALEILDQVTSRVQLDRQGHATVMAAIETLKKALDPEDAQAPEPLAVAE